MGGLAGRVLRPLLTEPADPLGAAAVRERVLRGWHESVERFREDANAEDDAVRAGYRDRLLVELLQNAADAAAGGDGRVLIRVVDRELRVANTGRRLDGPGLTALCTLRASAKRDDQGSIGRYGTGFAAVLTVTDAPVLLSGGAAVGWSGDRVRAELAELPALRAELDRRGGQVPVLRLPYAVAAADGVPAGYDTEVRLPLREGISAPELLAGLDDTLLLVLDAIGELVVEHDGARRVLSAERHPDGSVDLGGRRWLAATAEAPVPAALAAEGSPEGTAEVIRATAWWPRDGWPAGTPRVLFAPTPTDEPLSLPVLVRADVPLEAHRRRTIPGPLRTFGLAVAARAVVGLAAQLPGTSVLQLVPAGLPAGPVDAELGELLVSRLAGSGAIPGRQVLDVGGAGAAVHALLAGAGAEGPLVAGLLPVGWPPSSPALRRLGVERLDTAAVVALIAEVGGGRDAAWWREAWDALSGAPDRDALAALPVPLAGGGLAPGPRGLLIPAGPVPDGVATRLRLVDPAGTHPLQLALGAVAAEPSDLLAALRPEIEASFDDGDTGLAGPVLALVAAAALSPGELPWLAELTLTDTDGQPAPAGELVLPDSALDRMLADDAPLGVVTRRLVEAHGPGVLRAVGVGDGLVVVHGDAAVAELDGGEEFLDAHPDLSGELIAGVRDLDWLRWPEALQLLDSVPAPAHAYLRWWCAREPVFGGLLPGEVQGLDPDPLLTGLYDPPPAGVPARVIDLLGCRTALPRSEEELLDLLDRLGDPDRVVGRGQLRTLLIHVAEVGGPGLGGAPPLRVRAVDPAGRLVVIPGAEAVLVDAPDLLPLIGSRPVVPLPAALAGRLAPVLAVPVASSLGDYRVVSEDPLTVSDVDGRPTRVTWRMLASGTFLAEGPEGLGRAQAWVAGEWDRRHAYVARARADDGLLAGLEDDLES